MALLVGFILGAAFMAYLTGRVGLVGEDDTGADE